MYRCTVRTHVCTVCMYCTEQYKTEQCSTYNTHLQYAHALTEPLLAMQPTPERESWRIRKYPYHWPCLSFKVQYSTVRTSLVMAHAGQQLPKLVACRGFLEESPCFIFHFTKYGLCRKERPVRAAIAVPSLCFFPTQTP